MPLVREHIPLEQGLRHIIFCIRTPLPFVREHIPLEQGLRQHDRTQSPFRLPLSESIFH